jgi:LysM repeat protein/ribosomal protein L40E
MSPQADSKENETRVCPRCGTRLGPSATRCVVCGSEVRSVSGLRALGRRFDITLSLPLALLLLVIFTVLSAGLTFAAMRLTGAGSGATPTSTVSATPTITQTLEPSPTATLWPTETPLPPTEHTISLNETCIGLAAFYEVSVRSIIELNPGLQCDLLTVGTVILIPHPTPTPTAPPTATLSPAEATDAACDRITYTVKANDTLSGIAANYNVEMQAIMEYNGMSRETVFEGQVLIIPLCRRLPTPGPTPTPTPPPPYLAPNLLLPLDGAPFTLANDTVALQWAAIGALRENEYYQVIIVDVTEGSGTRRIEAFAKDTKYIVPTTFRPHEAIPHVFRWWVTTVRQTGTDPDGNPLYDSAGATSVARVFTWSGATPPTPSP